MLVKLSITSDYCFNELANHFHAMIRHVGNPVGFFLGVHVDWCVSHTQAEREKRITMEQDTLVHVPYDRSLCFA